MTHEKSRAEKFAEKWFDENGFSYELKKQYLSKTKYTVTKDGVTDDFELPSAVTEYKNYMKQYGESFKMKCEIERLRRQVEAQ